MRHAVLIVLGLLLSSQDGTNAGCASAMAAGAQSMYEYQQQNPQHYAPQAVPPSQPQNTYGGYGAGGSTYQPSCIKDSEYESQGNTKTCMYLCGGRSKGIVIESWKLCPMRPNL